MAQYSVGNIYDLNKEPQSFDELAPLSGIYSAYKRLKQVTKRTPLQQSLKLSDLYKAKIYLKREDLQDVGTYKVRGVFNKINSLSNEEKKKGITCASVGNHAQSVAYVCNLLKIQCTIFMPTSTQTIRINGVKDFGKQYTTIELYGDSFEECHSEAEKRSQQDGTTFIHAFDDEQIIAGQGTIAIEILEDFPEEQIDVLIFPVGGGSVGSGLVSYFKQMSPNTLLIGCEPENAPQMHKSLMEHKIIDLTQQKHFSDTVTVKRAGKLTFQILNQVLNDVVLVPEGLICTVMMKLFNQEGMLVERAGALTIGALEKIKDQIVGKNIVCLISGLNSDLTKMNDIRMLSEMHKGLQYYLFISFYTKPGALKQFLLDCLTPTDEITHFDYTKKNNREKGPALVGIRVKSRDEFEAIKQKMEACKISYKILTPNQEVFRLLL